VGLPQRLACSSRYRDVAQRDAFRVDAREPRPGALMTT
jgi:hypothetical protein